MKKYLKRAIAMLVAVILVCGIAFSGELNLLQVNASDSASTSFCSEGASVAVNTETVLMRFGFLLDTNGTEWTTYFKDGQLKDGYRIGVLCLPYDMSDGGANLTLDNEYVAKAQLTEWADASENKKISYVYLDANQIPEGQEHRTLIVKGYIADTSGNILSYTEPVKASMSYVAYKNQSAFTDEQKAKYLKEHSVTVISAKTEEEKTVSAVYGTDFSDAFAGTLYKDEACTTKFTNSYVSGKTKVYCKNFVDEGLEFLYMSDGSTLTPSEDYEITGNNQIKITDTKQKDWLSLRVNEAKDAENFEFSVTFSNEKNKGFNFLGVHLVDADGTYQRFGLNNDYNVWLRGATGEYYPGNSATKTDEIALKLRKVGNEYTFTYGSQEWSFNAATDRIVGGTDTLASKGFDSSKISDLRILVFDTTDLNVTSWNFTNLDSKIGDGLKFYAAGTWNDMNSNAYTITEDNEIQVSETENYFSAHVEEAVGVKNFELSVTFGGCNDVGDNAYYGMSVCSDESNIGNKVSFGLNKSCKAELRNNYVYISGNQTTSADEITIKLKRIGTHYTFSFGTKVWSFDASDKLNGSDTLEYKFATNTLTDLRILAYNTTGITIQSWKFTNLDNEDKAVEDGLEFYAAGGSTPVTDGAYSLDDNNHIQINNTSLSDWFTAKVTEAEQGVDNFEISATFSGIPKNGARLGVSLVNADGVRQNFWLKKTDNKNYAVTLEGSNSLGYKFDKTSGLTSKTDINEITIKLKRIGTQYTFSYGGAVWTFDSADLLDGTNSLESQFATTEVKDIRFFAYETRGIKIKSWSFTNFGPKIDEGLEFLDMLYGNALTQSNEYNITENNQIEITGTNPWVSARVKEAKNVENFEIAITFSGEFVGTDQNSYMAIHLVDADDTVQRFGLNNAYQVKLRGATGDYLPGFSVTKTDEITLKLRKEGNEYTFTYGSEQWSFNAETDKIVNGTDTLASKGFDSSMIAEIRFLAFVAKGITIESWSFTNLDANN